MPLVLSRRKGQSIHIGPFIRVTVTELHRSSCKLQIETPKRVAVVRGEIAAYGTTLERLELEEDRTIEQQKADGDDPDSFERGRPVVVPGVDLAGMTADERDRAMARWLFSADELPQVDDEERRPVSDGPDLLRHLLALSLRGFVACGLVPVDNGSGSWESLSEATRMRWRALSAQVLFSVDKLRAMQGTARPKEPAVVWRGSVVDLVNDLRAVLTHPELAELAGESALAWREEWLKDEKTKKPEGRKDG